MNCRTARVPGQKREPQEAAYVTLGAGARATAGSYARDVTAETLARLKDENAKLDHPVQIGALGELIEASGGETFAIGGETDVSRSLAGYWTIGGRRSFDSEFFSEGPPSENLDAPYGIESNIPAMRKALGAGFPGFYPHPRLTLVYFGDVARAEKYGLLCTPTFAQRHRTRAIERLGELLSTAVADISDFRRGFGSSTKTANIMLVSAFPSIGASHGDRLAPILMWGPDVKPGLLTSASTKTPGLVTNTDFLPTAANLLGLKAPSGMIGRPMTVTRLSGSPAPPTRVGQQPEGVPDAATDAAGQRWARLHDDWYSRSRQQATFGGLPILQAAALIAAVALSAAARRMRCCVETLSKWSAALALIPLWLPSLLLFLPLTGSHSLAWSGAILGVGLAVPVIAALARPATVPLLAAIPLAALAALLALDLAVGTPVLRNGWLSYSVMEGARYYGIGNEYCGALLIAALGVCLFMARLPAWTCVGGLALLALLVGWPAGGANAGGFLGLAIGFGSAGLVWWRGRVRLREVAGLLIVVAVAMACVVGYDLVRDVGSQSHIGRSLSSGPVAIALRKAQLNAWLLLRSPWSLVLLTAGTALITSLRLPGSALRLQLAENRRFAGAFMGMLWGSLALLLLNDSGVVAAAESLSMTWAVAHLSSREPGSKVNEAQSSSV